VPEPESVTDIAGLASVRPGAVICALWLASPDMSWAQLALFREDPSGVGIFD